MKIKIQQFLSGNHSWGVVGQNIAQSLIKNHDVHLKSTNGYDNFSSTLLPYVKKELDKNYDLEISYTCMINFPYYLNRSQNKFGIWCYEWPILPQGFAKYHQSVDKILAPSNFARDVFINNKIPEEKVITIPHGINIQQYQNKNKFTLKTKKTRKILVLIQQNHLRKNIEGMLKAYGEAFNKNDDVCLVAKISSNKDKEIFNVNVSQIFNNFYKSYPQHAEIEFISSYVDDIVTLYNACDIVYTLSFAEGFYLPGLEGLACNKINICPNYGGQLDFLNSQNSLLVEGKIVRADVKMQYWSPNIQNTVFQSDITDAATKLKKAVYEYDSLLLQFSPHMNVNEYDWNLITNKILNLAK